MKSLTMIAVSALAATTCAQDTALTLYNQNFAVVRERIDLTLEAGENQVSYSGITAHAEPDSVILRDLTGSRNLRILEQNYRADPISQGLLLNRFEGQEIDFLSGTNIIRGTIIRSGYVPHYAAMHRYGSQYAMNQYSHAGAGGSGQPIIEVDGQLRFSLPGQPLFPALGDDTILKPTFNWLLASDQAGPTEAELCYVSGGMSWEADYNIVAPENSDVVEIIGWVTMDNQSGRTFDHAKIKLMAGDVEKLDQGGYSSVRAKKTAIGFSMADSVGVTEKTFDEYHLYELPRRTTLRDRETKQVEFLKAEQVKSKTVYIYDGLYLDPNRYRGWNYDSIRGNRDYGTTSNPKVWVMREFKNTKENGLGIALPKGRTRFYRRDSDDGQLEFTGENMIDHTPKDETVRLFTGNAFDLVGERKRTGYQINSSSHWIDESFEIKIRNRKEHDAVELRVVEHLYRSAEWMIAEESHASIKTEANTMEFRIQLEPGEEKVITYTVHYNW